MKFILFGYVHREDYLDTYEYMAFPDYDVNQLHGKILKKFINKKIDENSGLTAATIVFSSVHEDLFNIVGHYIANNRINPNNVKVILFTDEHERIDCHYDNDGYLVGHPLGFFHWS